MFTIIILLFCIFGAFDADDSSPDGLQKCHFNDNECIQRDIQYLIEKYPNGNDTINFPTIEPLRLNFFNITDDPGHSTLYYKNVELFGFGNSKITVEGFTNDLTKSNVTIKILIPKLTLTGDYKLRMKFASELMYGEGRVTIIFDNLEFILKFIPTIITGTGGKQFMKIENINVDYSTQRTVFNATNLYDGDEIKGMLANKFLNDNQAEVMANLKPAVAPAWSKVFANLFNNIIGKYPINELFL